ncbi:unnamed protein product, partial [Linum tenue]
VSGTVPPASSAREGELPRPTAGSSPVAPGKKTTAASGIAVPPTQGLRALADAVRPKKKRVVVKGADPRGAG